MNELRTFLISCAAVCSTVILSAQSTNTSNAENSLLVEELKEYLDKASRKQFSGTVLIAKNGEPILSRGIGEADREHGIPNSAATVYDIGSLTKQFTAAAILKLEMQGGLKVTDPVSKYLPEFAAAQKDRTLHQLLTHTAGFPGAIGNDYEAISEAEFIRMAIERADWGSDNPSYEYSNVGYSLLAIILERASGMDYEAYLSEYLFKPASLTQTGYMLPDWEEDLIAVGYENKSVWGRPNSKNWSDKGPYLHLKGNGGLLSTVEDLYQWQQALSTDKILSKEARAKYFKAQVAEGPEGDTFYGYGWVIIPHEKRGTIITHNGGNGVFFADFWNLTETNNTVIVLSNASNGFAEELAIRLVRML